MSRFKPPEPLNFNNPSEWEDWKERFARYRIASKLNKDTDEVQISALIYSMGKEAEHIFKSLQFDVEGDRAKYDKVHEKFNEYFVPKRNIIHERAKFHQRIQNPGESVETFVRGLYEIAEHCNFTDKNEHIRDRVVIGITDKELSEKLQLISDLTLEQAIERARQSEQVKQQMKDQSASVKHVESVRHSQNNAGQSQGRGKGQGRGRGRGRGNRGDSNYKHSKPGRNDNSYNCNKCNQRHQRDRCYAKGKQCHRCHGYNHFAVCCTSTRSSSVQEVYDATSDSSLFLGSVTCNDNEAAWRINLKLCGKIVNFKIDSGADTSVMSDEVYCSLKNPPKLEPPKSTLYGPGTDSKLTCLGHFVGETTHKGKQYAFPVHVIEGKSNLLGRSAAHTLGLIQKVDSVETSVFGSFGLLKCEPVKITLRDNATPYCLTTSRRVAFPLMSKVATELDRLENEGIIEKIHQPTDWCAPMVPVLKKNGNVRICVDLKRLNEAVKREHYMLPNLDDVAPKLAGAKVFSKLDASSGFYQIPLHPDSCKLTTFITPMGRYCFKRVPFGITSAPEIFQRKMTELITGLEGTEAIIDDVLIYGTNREEHDKRLEAVIRRIHESGLKLNRDKCEFRKGEVEYFGHRISAEGISPTEDRVRAISEMPAPCNVAELRRVVGMINYLGRFVPDLASVISPMTDLLKSDKAWTWESPQQEAFERVKSLLTRTPVLTFYNQNCPIVVSADASSYGLGGALYQQEGDNLKPIAFCSRKLSETEIKYAQIEKECLAALWACEKFSRYLIGLDSFRLLTDHKPLVPLINTQDLDKVPIRCQRMLMRLRVYNLKAEHVPGKHLVVPDTLSRCPIDEVHDDFQDEIKIYVDSVDTTRPIADKRIQQITKATFNDGTLQEVINHTRYGWPTHINDVRSEIRDYFAARNDLSESRGLLLYRDRIVIPENIREEILNSLHDGHLGLTKTRAKAQSTVWWPKIARDIQSKIVTCKFCQVNKPTQHREPMKCTPLPLRPWQRVGADLCTSQGKQYLVVTDYYSRFIELAYLETTTSAQVIGKLKNMFSRWGIPEEVMSDNGSQFTSEEFRLFAEEYQFKQTFSSPHYPQSNGAAESAVKTAKRILKQDDVFKALMAYRSTPIEATGVSPAELLLGRKIRTCVPILPKSLMPEWPDSDEIRRKDSTYKEYARMYYDKGHGASPLTELQPGDSVRIKTDKDKVWSSTGTVQCNLGDRSYLVNTPQGNTFRRNRRFLQRVDKNTAFDDFEHHNVCVPMSSPMISSRDEPSQPMDEPQDSLLTKNDNTDKPDVVTTRSGRACHKPRRFDDYVTV